MPKKVKSLTGKPICYACHRPFDPASPGATRNMGPTCAKRFASGATSVEFQLDLNFIDDGEAAPPQPVRTYRLPKATLLASLLEKSELAKAAFDDLRQEFTRANSAFYGENARELFEGLRREPLERYALSDPSLEWLTPEFDLHLLVDHSTGRAYYWRLLNEMETLLFIDTRGSMTARRAIDFIRDFSLSLADYRGREAEVQLEFGSLI